MRLGIDASNLRVGGGLTHLAELLGAARPREHGIEAVTVWASRATLERLPAGRPWLRAQHEPVLDGWLPGRLAWQRLRLPRLARQSCDVLFVPGGGSGGSFEPFVTMSRNLLPFEPLEARRYGTSPMRVKLALLRAQQRTSIRRADGVIYLNEYAQRAVMPFVHGARGATAIVPHGVSDAFRRPPARQRKVSASPASEPFRVLYVSRVDMYKHQWKVVEAAAMLKRRGVPVGLTLVGGAYPPALRRLRREMRRSDPHGAFVYYRGEIAHARLPDTYHHAELFVFASSCEAMPNVLLEAMAAGLPIACSARGPMPDILGEEAAYFDPECPRSIEAAVGRLTDDAALREAAAARAYGLAEAYTWERCAAETLSFLARVAASSARRPGTCGGSA